MNKFVSQYDVVNIKPAKLNGLGYKEVHYSHSFDVDGNDVYTVREEMDVVEYVNSFKSCSLKCLLERMALMPLSEKLVMLQADKQGNYGDVSDIPKDLSDAVIKIQTLQQQYPEVFKLVKEGKTFDEAMKVVYSNKPVEKSVETVENKEVT